MEKENSISEGIPVKRGSLKEALKNAPIVNEIGKAERIKPVSSSKEDDGN